MTGYALSRGHMHCIYAFDIKAPEALGSVLEISLKAIVFNWKDENQYAVILHIYRFYYSLDFILLKLVLRFSKPIDTKCVNYFNR